MAVTKTGQNQVPLTIFQGCKIERFFRSRMEDGSYRDFTGMTTICSFVPSLNGDTVEVDVEVTEFQGQSALQLTLPGSVTQDMEIKDYRWSIKLVPAGGDEEDDAEYFVGGIATVKPS